MNSPLQSLISSGTKLWLDSVDPSLTKPSRDQGITGATSNPIIIADLIKTGRFNPLFESLRAQKIDPEDAAWAVTDQLVSLAELVFKDIFDKTKGNDGYVSFELDPLLEAPECRLSVEDKAREYIKLAKKWSAGHPNRMIKIPATAAGFAALPEIVASEIPLNITLIFTEAQYRHARDQVWRGAQRLKDLSRFKSVYSIFVSRLDVYADQKYPALKSVQEGLIGIINAKKIWRLNRDFWTEHKTPLQQEIVFASTGTKKPIDKPWKYIAALAGSDIQTNPPGTNEAAAKSGMTFKRQIDEKIGPELEVECFAKINWPLLEADLMNEGLSKFADPQKALISLVKGLF